MKNTILIIALFALSTLCYSQRENLDYNPTRIEKYTGEIEVKNKLDLLFKAIESSKVDSDSTLRQRINCYQEFSSQNVDSSLKINEPITDYIHIIDLNNDHQDDIIFDPYCWGCTLMSTYIFINNNGNYKIIFEKYGIPIELKFKNDKINTYTTYTPPIPSPFGVDFCVFYEYSFSDTLVQTNEKFSIYENLISQIKNKPVSRATTNKLNILLYYENSNINKQYAIRIELTDKNYKIIKSIGAWKLVIVNGKLNARQDYEHKIINNNYYCGWTNEL